MTKIIKLNSGAIRRIFDMNGKRVWKIEDLDDGGLYVASSGERFRAMNYITYETSTRGAGSVRSLEFSRGETRGRRHINASTGGLLTTDDEKEAIASDSVFGPIVISPFLISEPWI
jgi:hypothetical protein